MEKNSKLVRTYIDMIKVVWAVQSSQWSNNILKIFIHVLKVKLA